jgi:hypothetical protein
VRKFSKYLVSGLVAISLAGGAIKLSYKDHTEKNRNSGLNFLAREIDYKNPQRTLEHTLSLINSDFISEIIWDPEFKKSDEYIRENLSGRFSNKSIGNYILGTRSQAKGHNLGVVGILYKTGEGKKRPVFARRELLDSDSVFTLADLKSAIIHEGVHAEEEARGLEIDERRIKGEELTNLIENGIMRVPVISGAGELDAYATQLEDDEKNKRGISQRMRINLMMKIYQLNGLFVRGLCDDKFTGMERKYIETKMGKHKETIKLVMGEK